jgi:hypothetical protein
MIRRCDPAMNSTNPISVSLSYCFGNVPAREYSATAFDRHQHTRISDFASGSFDPFKQTNGKVGKLIANGVQ